jgi:hypothetical protein
MIDDASRDAMIHAARFLERTDLALLMIDMLDDPPTHARGLVRRIWTRVYDLADDRHKLDTQVWKAGPKSGPLAHVNYDRVRRSEKKVQHAYMKLQIALNEEEIALYGGVLVKRPLAEVP